MPNTMTVVHSPRGAVRQRRDEAEDAAHVAPVRLPIPPMTAANDSIRLNPYWKTSAGSTARHEAAAPRARRDQEVSEIVR